MRFWINLEIELGKFEAGFRTDHFEWRPWAWRDSGRYRWGFGWLWFAVLRDK